MLSAQTIELMTARQAGGTAEPRVLGWRIRPDAWGDWPAGTIWHTGFTGTSLLICPALQAAVVLLTNAVHPVRLRRPLSCGPACTDRSGTCSGPAADAGPGSTRAASVDQQAAEVSSCRERP